MMFGYFLLEIGLKSHQNHSLPKLGTEKTPQCMKMPNFAWSYHSGSGLESIDSQLGSYFALLVLINSIDKSKKTTVKTPISSQKHSDSDKKKIRRTGRLSHDKTKVQTLDKEEDFYTSNCNVSSSWNTGDVWFQRPLIRRGGSTNQIEENAALPGYAAFYISRSSFVYACAFRFSFRNLFLFWFWTWRYIVHTCKATLTVTVISLRGILTK